MDPTSGPDATESWVSAISTTYIVLESRCGGGEMDGAVKL